MLKRLKRVQEKGIYKETRQLFKLLKSKGKIIAVASKGWCHEISLKYLKELKLDMYIDNFQIFPTGNDKEYPYKFIDRHDKRYHLFNIFNKYNISPEHVVFFDDNKIIIDNLRKNIPSLDSIHIENGIKIEYIIPFL